MEFLEMARERYSVRRFDTERKVGKEAVGRILEAARLAPSAHNLQSARILVIQEDRAIAKLKDCTPCHYNAPLAFLVSFDREACWRREADGAISGPFDAAIAATHMMFEAFEQGIGCTWVMGFDETALQAAYHIPEKFQPAAVLVCGYPAVDVRPGRRHARRQPVEAFTARDDYEEEKDE